MILNLTGVKFGLTGVQTFTTISSLNNPVYGQPSIMKIIRYIVKKSVVGILPLICILLPVCSLQSTDCVFTLTAEICDYQGRVLKLLEGKVK